VLPLFAMTWAAEGQGPSGPQGQRDVTAWLAPQPWIRDAEEPVLGLGTPGAWDDTHLFAPCVAHENGTFSLWYCGSTGAVSDRVFRVGLATSPDGIHFTRHSASPVLEFGNGKRSVLTPTLLRSPDGAVLREHGALRMWFSSTDFAEAGSRHTLHETSSIDGIAWAPPSPAQLTHAYAPTVIKVAGAYHMWYTDVAAEPWVIRHARSEDGTAWQTTERAAIEIDQPWERDRLFYPTVLKADGLFLMWYGAYWRGQPNKTALGFAVSVDGVEWRKSPHNPVFRPDPDRPWESHYTTSQSVLRQKDGTWRIWYASRKAPPHVNKYFAVGTARWEGPGTEPL